jgi:hypothetical protein
MHNVRINYSGTIYHTSHGRMHQRVLLVSSWRVAALALTDLGWARTGSTSLESNIGMQREPSTTGLTLHIHTKRAMFLATSRCLSSITRMHVMSHRSRATTVEAAVTRSLAQPISILFWDY